MFDVFDAGSGRVRRRGAANVAAAAKAATGGVRRHGHGGRGHGVRAAGRAPSVRSVGPGTAGDRAGRVPRFRVRARLRGGDVGRGAQRSPGRHRSPGAVPDTRTRRQPGRVRAADRTVRDATAAASICGGRRTSAPVADRGQRGPGGRKSRVRYAQVGGPVAAVHAGGRVLPAEHVPRGRAGRGRAAGQHAARVLGGELPGGDQRGGELREPVLHGVREAHMHRAQGHLRHRHGRRVPSDQRAGPDGRHGEEYRGRSADAGRR